MMSGIYFESISLFGMSTFPLHYFITFSKNYWPNTQSNKPTILPETNPKLILNFTSNFLKSSSFIYNEGFIYKALKKFTFITIFGFDNQAKSAYVLLSFPITHI